MGSRLNFTLLVGVLACTAISSCATSPSKTSDFCLVAHPITVRCVKDAKGLSTCDKSATGYDTLTDFTAQEIRAYNATGVALCGWKPPGK